ncbi:unnamed protein product [Danaus chrysippus]|uniref:(African queen) hypothetical protein n=1 Tax=Danaus chrysippus TaxID=151541 RepID=A0A8J2QS53_9NEOP|nr:unnamed protein product [Danaus chrysippus]
MWSPGEEDTGQPPPSAGHHLHVTGAGSGTCYHRRCIPEFVLENVVVLITMSRRTVGAITDEVDMAGARLAECLEAMLPNHPDDQQPLSNIAFFYTEQNMHNVQRTSTQTSGR